MLFRYMEGNNNSHIVPNLACPPPFSSNQELHSITAMKSTSDFDMFQMMKENALFLLELSSTHSRKYQERTLFYNATQMHFLCNTYNGEAQPPVWIFQHTQKLQNRIIVFFFFEL